MNLTHQKRQPQRSTQTEQPAEAPRTSAANFSGHDGEDQIAIRTLRIRFMKTTIHKYSSSSSDFT